MKLEYFFSKSELFRIYKRFYFLCDFFQEYFRIIFLKKIYKKKDKWTCNEIFINEIMLYKVTSSSSHSWSHLLFQKCFNKLEQELKFFYITALEWYVSVTFALLLPSKLLHNMAYGCLQYLEHHQRIASPTIYNCQHSAPTLTLDYFRVLNLVQTK